MNKSDIEALAPNRYYDHRFDRDTVKISPGEYYVTNQNILLVTVLGSCVAACIRDKKTGISGINHFMLPGAPSTKNLNDSSARYGSYAMELLIGELIKIGAMRNNLEAKIFGGGNVLSKLKGSDVGKRNVLFVKEYLLKASIPIIAEDVLGIYPRKVYFFADTNKVLIRKLKKAHNTTIIDREKEYESRLNSATTSSDIEPFN